MVNQGNVERTDLDNTNGSKDNDESKRIIKLISYDEKNFDEKLLTDFELVKDLIKPKCVNWLDVAGKIDFEMLNYLRDNFNIHPLVIEDIISTDQRLKIEFFTDYIFIVLKAVNYNKNKEIELEQISIILGKDFVFSFQEYMPNQFAEVFDRIKTKRGRIRKLSNDYLAYVLIDVLVDSFFIILEEFSEKIDDIEDVLIQNPSPEVLQSIYKLKKDMIMIRKATWPLREAISQLTRMPSDLVKQSTIIYITDIYDHIIQIIDTTETYRESLSSMIDIFMSSVSNKMNEIMKVLTIIATIFIPLTFIAGIYGMNFLNMPELAMKWGYLMAWCIMIIIAIGMIIYFRRRKWL
ncbi:MAG: magnesium/cobalt transporter CorA [Asgard group archaeon]|nr:magnesium/cobalt transporter CorA [Asgard group archaeon]